MRNNRQQASKQTEEIEYENELSVSGYQTDLVRVCCFAVEYLFNMTANTNNIVHCLRISGVSNVPLSLARGVYF